MAQLIEIVFISLTNHENAPMTPVSPAHPRSATAARLALCLLPLALFASGCMMTGPAPTNPYEARMHADFQRDRDNCRAVAEQTMPYVNPKNGNAVSERSYRVEGETQKCMLNRGWNDPRYDGWKAGRS